MTIDLDVAEELEAEQLIVNGRYRIHPQGGGKPKLYTRATSWAEMLEDSVQLRDWRARHVAIGLGMRPDLLACIQATPVDDKDTLDVYCEEAFRAAGGVVKANWGTAAHGFFGRIIGGETLDVPPSLADDVKAAVACLGRHGLVPMPDMIEQVLVCELLGVAGRDDAVCINGDGEMFVCDLKTGDKLVDYAMLKTALQLSLYANADTVYDPDTHTHRPMPAVSKTIAYVIHRPLGAEHCDLIEVDIAAGWRYASGLAKDVRAARNHGKRKGGDSLFRIVPEPENADWAQEDSANQVVIINDPSATALRSWVLGRLKALDHGDHANARAAMKARWPHGVASFRGGHQHTKTELDAIVMILDVVEADFEVPFGESDPTIVRPVPVAVEERLPAVIDEGGYISEEELHDILALVEDLDPEWTSVINGWARDAHACGHTFSIKLARTQRRLNIYRAILELAPLLEPDGEADDLVRATIALVVPDVAMPTTSIGEALGVLTIDEAARLAKIAKAVAADPPALTYDPDNGAVRWANHPNQTEGQTA